MRIISGSGRGRKLLTPVGARVRPTADRVKEALFSILLSRFANLSGLTILDLFAGTGSLGIEALSRGGAHCLFADSHPESIRTIRDNLQLTGFAAKAEVQSGDAVRITKMLGQRQSSFDIILLDPPYRETELLHNVLIEIAANRILSPEGVIIVETDKRRPPDEITGLTLLDRRIYGDTTITILGAGREYLTIIPDHEPEHAT